MDWMKFFLWQSWITALCGKSSAQRENEELSDENEKLRARIRQLEGDPLPPTEPIGQKDNASCTETDFVADDEITAVSDGMCSDNSTPFNFTRFISRLCKQGWLLVLSLFVIKTAYGYIITTLLSSLSDDSIPPAIERFVSELSDTLLYLSDQMLRLFTPVTIGLTLLLFFLVAFDKLTDNSGYTKN